MVLELPEAFEVRYPLVDEVNGGYSQARAEA
jgi:hypothetical protein